MLPMRVILCLSSLMKPLLSSFATGRGITTHQVKKCGVDTHGKRVECELTGFWGGAPSGFQGAGQSPWSEGQGTKRGKSGVDMSIPVHPVAMPLAPGYEFRRRLLFKQFPPSIHI